MDKNDIKKIVGDIENQNNKTLLECSKVLYDEFNETKELVIRLTRHIDAVEKYYNQIIEELEKRNMG